MASPPDRAEDLALFYTDLIGLERVDSESGQGQVVLRGYPRRGPRIVLRLDPEADDAGRRKVLIQIASLRKCVDRLIESRIAWEELRGWAFYDRRIFTFDPAGNLVELVAYHTF